MAELDAYTAEVAAAFDLGEPLRELREVPGGEQARIWRLDTTRGSFAVKEPRRGFEPRTDGVDVAFQDAVRRQTAIPMPSPVRHSSGASVIALAGRRIRVSTWLDLRAPDRTLDPQAVGRLLAALHTVDFALPEDSVVDPWYRAPVGEPAWLDLLGRLRAAGAPFAGVFESEIGHLLELETLLEPPTAPRICHCDLWAENLLQTASGELCVIDWDNCGPADPAHELAMVIYEFGYPDPHRMRTMYESYLGAGGPARLSRPGQLTMVIGQFGHFWQLAVESWLDPRATAAERAHQQDRVAELMDAPLRAESCRQVISAISA